MDEKQKCCESVRGEGQWGGFHRHQCPRDAKVERDGKGYCKQHDPVGRKTKADAAYARMEEKWKDEKDEANREDRMRKAYPLLVEALRNAKNFLGDQGKFPVFLMDEVDKALKAAEEKEGQLG